MDLSNLGIIIINYDNTIVTIKSLEKFPPGHGISLLRPVTMMATLSLYKTWGTLVYVQSVSNLDLNNIEK